MNSRSCSCSSRSRTRMRESKRSGASALKSRFLPRSNEVMSPRFVSASIMTYVVARFTAAFRAMSCTGCGPSSSAARYTFASFSESPSFSSSRSMMGVIRSWQLTDSEYKLPYVLSS